MVGNPPTNTDVSPLRTKETADRTRLRHPCADSHHHRPPNGRSRTAKPRAILRRVSTSPVSHHPMTHSFRFTALVIATAVASRTASAQRTKPDTSDAFRWLEDVNGARAMSWVNAENAKTAAVLEKDHRFATLYREALTIAEARSRSWKPPNWCWGRRRT